jgi:hypothetical protein
MRSSKLLATVTPAMALAAAIIVLPAAEAGAQPPSSTVLLPANGATVSGTQVILDALPTTGATEVQFELSGNGLSSTVIATVTTGAIWGWAAAWNSTSVPNGTYTLQSVPTEAPYGAYGATSPTISITVNNPPPSATIVLPTDYSSVSGNQWIDAVPSPGATSVYLSLSGFSPSQPCGGGCAVGYATPTFVGWLVDWNTTNEQNSSEADYLLTATACYSWGTGTNGGCESPTTIADNGASVFVNN